MDLGHSYTAVAATEPEKEPKGAESQRLSADHTAHTALTCVASHFLKRSLDILPQGRS